MAGLLADVFSFGDTLKRKARGLLDDPMGTISQFVNNENDRARAFNQLTSQSTDEMVSGQTMGPASQKLAGLLADAYNPAGMFIGASAKTWDKAAAEKAQKMLREGVDPRQVWKETGTFKGADGALRQEIDDSVAQIKNSSLPTIEINHQRYPDFKLSDAIEHQPLFDAYPDARGIQQSFQAGKSENGVYREGADWISISDRFQKKVPTAHDQQAIDEAYNALQKFKQQTRAKRVDALMDGIVEKEGFGSDRLQRVADRYAQPIENQRSVLGREYTSALDAANSNPRSEFVLSPTAKSIQLHEIQHAIQQREGWAKGGSPDDATLMPYVRKFYADNIDGFLGESHQLVEMAKQRAYNNLAGEAEARATQSRMNMNAAQRREVYPFDSYDVPLDQLIVRGGLLGQ